VPGAKLAYILGRGCHMENEDRLSLKENNLHKIHQIKFVTINLDTCEIITAGLLYLSDYFECPTSSLVFPYHTQVLKLCATHLYTAL
jgi:hypothetical protein